MPLEPLAEQADAIQADVADVVFDALDVFCDSLRIDPEGQEEPGQDLVAEADVLGDAAPALGEGESPIALVGQIPELPQLFDHDADAGPAEAQFPGDVRDPGVAFLDHEFLDPFEVVLLADRGDVSLAHRVWRSGLEDGV